MASVKYSALITEIKGKLGGSVFQGNKNGFTLRQDPAKKQSSSVRVRGWSTQVHQNFSRVTKLWNSLTQEQKNSWLALQPVWLFYDKFGKSYQGSAFQIFTSCNLNRLGLDAPELELAPSYNAAVDPVIKIDDYHEGAPCYRTITNGDAIGQYLVYYISYPTKNSIPFEHSVLMGKIVQDIVSITPWDYEPQITAALGYSAPVGSYFNVKVFTCRLDYPQQQFVQYFKVKVV